MIKHNNCDLHPASFRDPSGHIYFSDGVLLRQVNEIYKKNFDHFNDSGLCQELIAKELLIHHEVLDSPQIITSDSAYKILKPDVVSFISYPYEWCFSQLKDAALLTLHIQRLALEKNMSLKDASAYNVQFHHGKPIFIDTLSFELYRPGEPWVAYRQFCQHFLAPLLLMSYLDIRLGKLLRDNIDGIPLDLASLLLPWSTKFNFSLQLHIHMHAKSQNKYADKQLDVKKLKKVSKHSMLGLLDNLESLVGKLKWQPGESEWGDYYNFTNYTDDAMDTKRSLISDFVESTDSKTAWDLGANNGEFSRIISQRGIDTVAFDIDSVAVEKNYILSKKQIEKRILPLQLDLTNPSPAIGWMNNERESITDRGPADLVLSLALIHHLAISNNLPFYQISRFFSLICRWLIIEFVPKSDSQVKKLLSTREDIFPDYDKDKFELAFGKEFNMIKSMQIPESERWIYLYKAK
jgi:hypothetical protein